jgi:uncharacterized damage-inducible protein DinB
MEPPAMNKAEILLLLDYGHWATVRVLDAATNVSEEQFTACPTFHTMGLRDTLVHMLGAEQLLRIRIETDVSADPPRGTDFPNPAALRQRWQEEERAMRAYLSTLDDGALNGPFRSRRSSGTMSDPLTRWQILMHLVNHSTQHRSEAALLLTAFGHSPGDLDFGLFLHGRR